MIDKNFYNQMQNKSRKNTFKKLPWREQFKKYSYNNKKAQLWLARRLRQLRLIHPNLDYTKVKKYRSKIKHFSSLYFKPRTFSKDKCDKLFLVFGGHAKKYHLSKICPLNVKAKEFLYNNNLKKSLRKINCLKKELTYFPIFLKTSHPFLIKNNAYTIFKNLKIFKHQNIENINLGSPNELDLSVFINKLKKNLFFFSGTYGKKKALYFRLRKNIRKDFLKSLYINQRAKENFLSKKHQFNNFVGKLKKVCVKTKSLSMPICYNKQWAFNKAIKRFGITDLLFELSVDHFQEKKSIKFVWKGFLKYRAQFFVPNTEISHISHWDGFSRIKESTNPKKLKLRFKKQLMPFFRVSKKFNMLKRKNYVDDSFFRMIYTHNVSNSEGTNYFNVLNRTLRVRLYRSRNKKLRKRKFKKRVRKLRFILGYKRPKCINFSFPRHVEFNYKTFNGLHLGYSDNNSASYRIPFWLNIGKLATFLSY